MAQSPQPGRRTPSQENLLLDYVHRLEQHKSGRTVVHIHLSELRPFNRREHHVRAAADNFDPYIESLDGQLFVLKNADIFFIFKSEILPQIETEVQKIRYLFSDDPLVAEEEESESGFATWYDVENQYDEIVHLVQDMVSIAQDRQRTRQLSLGVLDPGHVLQLAGVVLKPQLEDLLPPLPHEHLELLVAPRLELTRLDDLTHD